MTKPLVIYHGNCQDGFTAAWACWKAHPNWEFYAAKHGEAPPDVVNREVYMLDFSYKRDVILNLASTADRIIILDHHKTAQEDLKDLPDNVEVHFDMDKSGARLSWDYFHARTYGPVFIDYVEDRDLWRFAYPETKDISAYIFSLEYTFENWDSLENVSVEEALVAGAAINRKQEKDTAELCKNKYLIEIYGHWVWTVNLPYTFSSDAGHLLCQGQPFASTYYFDGSHYQFSLRSSEDGIDVSEIAKRYGGGGHKHIAGFRIDKLEDL